MPRRDPLLGGLSPAAFLRRHWQKRPLCVREAFPGFRDLVSAEALARLATREDVGSRLVLEKGGRRPWEVIPGPQDPRRLARMPDRHWTLLVDGVDRHVPAVADLPLRFAFIPRWRADDVMVSLAAPLGTVGPHVDAYDVFLVQGAGRRRWQVARRHDDAWRPGLDLRILRRFVPEQEWILEPGDMLYVPPGVAHHGVALEESLTYSVGFRAPSDRDLVAAALPPVVHATRTEQLYADPDLAPAPATGQISARALRRMRATLDRALSRLDDESFARSVGEMLTGTEDVPPPARRRMSARDLARRVRAGSILRRALATRAAYVRRPRAVLLFVNGRTFALPAALEPAAALLTGPRTADPGDLRRALGTAGFAVLAAELVKGGAFEVVGPARARGRP